MTTTTREKPILFSGPMVRAILDGRKTMTRRVVRPEPHEFIWKFEACESGFQGYERDSDRNRSRGKVAMCPYGIAGDRLWVRESFSLVPCSAGCELYPKGFDPTRSSVSQPNAPHEGVRFKATWDRSHSARWRPSIHMPRWASRITLEITSVKVERLQDISEADATAEGVDAIPDAPAQFTRRRAFIGLWDKINGKTYPWASNPWIWVVEFRRVTP